MKSAFIICYLVILLCLCACGDGANVDSTPRNAFVATSSPTFSPNVQETTPFYTADPVLETPVATGDGWELYLGDRLYITKLDSMTSLPNTTENNHFTEIHITESVKTVPRNNLGRIDCDTVIIEEGVLALNEYALQYWYTNELYIPGSVKYIGEGAFTNTQELVVSAENQNYRVVGGVLYDNEKGIALHCNRNAVEVTLRAGTVRIGHNAFRNCTMLTELTFSGTEESIGILAFAECGIQYLNLPSSLTVIQDMAFDYCANLRVLILPPNVQFDLYKEEVGSLIYESSVKGIVFTGDSAGFDIDIIAEYPGDNYEVEWIAFDCGPIAYFCSDAKKATLVRVFQTQGISIYYTEEYRELWEDSELGLDAYNATAITQEQLDRLIAEANGE